MIAKSGHEALGQQSEAELATRLLASPATERAVAEELCRRFAPRIRLFGLRHLRDEAAADDLVQDVLLVFLETVGKGRLRDPERVASFILGTCRHLVWNERRAERRRRRILDRFGFDLLGTNEASTPSLEIEDLSCCWTQLSQRERQILALTFLEEQSSEVIGQRLGLTTANVRVLRYRALRRLRDCLGIGPEGANGGER